MPDREKKSNEENHSPEQTTQTRHGEWTPEVAKRATQEVHELSEEQGDSDAAHEKTDKTKRQNDSSFHG